MQTSITRMIQRLTSTTKRSFLTPLENLLRIIRSCQLSLIFDKIAYAGLEQHKNMIFFTVNEIGNIESEVPIFVYAHLLFPHAPFMFDENGHYIEQEFHTNWDYYLGNYNFSMKNFGEVVENILCKLWP